MSKEIGSDSLNDILDLSKIEADRVDLETIDFDLVSVVESVVELMAVRANEKELELASFIGPEVPMRLKGDPGRLRQILLNLVGNAVKFTERGGVRIEVVGEAGEDESASARLRFRIVDSGIGIAEDRRDTLFEMFVQADNTTTRRFGGTGLGLAICRKLVRRMDGDITLRSSVGIGSTVEFTVSLDRGPFFRDAAFEDLRDAMTDKQVLIVDASEVNREVARAYMRALSAEVLLATGMDEALGLLYGHPFDIVIVDHAMVNEDGKALAELIRADRRFDDCALVLTMSAAESARRDAASWIGVDAVIAKPLLRTSLLEAMCPLLNIEGYGGEGVAAAEPSPDAPSPRELRLLLVEDNKVNQMVASELLTKIGHRVDIAANGVEAVRMHGGFPYDLILMDMQMPEMDGLEATRRIRAAEHGDVRIPIVAMTANAMVRDRKSCLEAGMDDYISKPIDVEELYRKTALWGAAKSPSRDRDGERKDRPVALVRAS